MSKPVVRRNDISLYSEEEQTLTQTFTTQWVAQLCGKLSTGEEVSMSRYGSSAKSALHSLEGAIEQEGWDLR